MKKLVIILSTVAFVLSISAFTVLNRDTTKKYGGSASVTVEAKSQTPNSDCAIKMFLDKASAGNKRVIDVTVECRYDNSLDAKEALAQEIKYDKKCYEQHASSITYDINGCEN